MRGLTCLTECKDTPSESSDYLAKETNRKYVTIDAKPDLLSEIVHSVCNNQRHMNASKRDKFKNTNGSFQPAYNDKMGLLQQKLSEEIDLFVLSCVLS